MTNPFYDPGDLRAAKVKELFTKIAPRYDLINDLQSFGLHRYWKRRAIRLAQPRQNELALDLCCGTGDLALMLAGEGTRVVGMDFSEPMLQVARSRAWKSDARLKHQPSDSTTAKLGSKIRPQLIQGDALRIPFPDATFEVVTVAYGLRNLADLKAGLREMQRVSRPGGRLVVLDFGKPDNALWRGLYFAYLKLFVPLLGLLVCGSASAYSYILESLKRYPAQHGVAAQMRELGMANIQVVNLLGGVMSVNYAEKRP